LRTNEFDPLAYIENAFLDKRRDLVPESDDLNVQIPSLTDYLVQKDKEESNSQVVAPPEEPASRVEEAVAEEPFTLETPGERLDLLDTEIPEMPIMRRERLPQPGLEQTNPDLFNGISHAIIEEISDTGNIEKISDASSIIDEINDAGAITEDIGDPAGEADKRRKFGKTAMSAPRPRRAKGPQGETAMDPELQNTWETLPKSIDFLFSFYDDSVTANYYRGEFKETRNDLIKRLLDPELSLEETSRLLGVCPATVRRYTNRKWLTHHRTTGGQRRFRLSDVVKFVEVHGRFPEE